MPDLSLAYEQPEAAAMSTPAGSSSRDHEAALAADHPDIRLEFHERLDPLAGEWRRFEAGADHTPFQSYGRLAKWQTHVGSRTGVRAAIVAGRDRHGELLFILPLAVERRRSARRLRWLASDLCDYNAPVLAKRFPQACRPDQFAALWRDVLALLRSHVGFDLVDLAKMPAKVGAQPNPFMLLPTTLHPNRAYLATLGPTWDAFYAAKRSSSTRRRERRHLKQLGEHGEVRFVEIADPRDAEETLDILFRQKARALARMGVESPFDRPGLREFFRDLGGDPELRDLVHLSRLDVGPTVAAVSLGLMLGSCYYLVLSSYDDGPLSRFGPGRAHLYAVMDAAIRRGFAQFDFTIGDEPYKRDWSDTEIALHDHLAAATVLGLPARATAAAGRRAKRFIKENPAVWHYVSRVRALSGRAPERAAAAVERDDSELP